MAYSYVRYTLTSGNMGTNSFSYSAFQTLGSGADPENTQFNVFWGDSELVLDTDYTVNTTTNTVTFLSPVTADWVEGDVIAIKRDTKKDDRYVDWTNNAGIDETDLDLEGDQLLFIAQEAWDEAQNALRKNAAGTKWYGQGLESYNCAPATLGSGWVTLDQVNNLINGGDTATLGETNEWCFTGDGATDDFVLNGAAANTNEENLFVTIDGVLLCPCDTSIYHPHPLADRLAPHLSGVSRVAATGVGKALWDSAADAVIADVAAEFAAAVAALAITSDMVSSATVRYVVQVDTRDSGSGIPTTVPVTFIGTAAEVLAYIATWDGSATWSGYVDWYDIVSPDSAYTWTQATRTLTFNDPPLEGADICVRQLTGTVAVDLADVSLDGSEIQDDAITINHLDFAAGTAYRVLKVDAAGDPSVGTITSAYISDFTAAVQSLQWRTMTAPTASVNLNSQKITSLQAGSDAGDGVNFGQLTTTNNRVTAVENQIDGGASGDNSSTALAVTEGVHPDLYYNNASNSRGSLLSDGTTACATEASAGDTNLLMKGFVPRWLKIFISGDITKGASTVLCNNVDIEFEFLNWDAENGYTGVVSTEDSGNRKIFNLNRPRNFDTNYGDYDFPSGLAYGDAQLVIETISPYRVWLRIRDVSDASAVCRITKHDDVNLPGSLQVVAIKGL